MYPFLKFASGICLAEQKMNYQNKNEVLTKEAVKLSA
jgi:hypothetical protein